MSELFFPDQEIFEKAFYDPDFQALLADLKSVAEQQPLDRDIKAFLVAEGVDTQRAQSIENDPRKFYEFIALDESLSILDDEFPLSLFIARICLQLLCPA